MANLVEADGRHGPLAEFPLELLRQLHLLLVEAGVPEQHADLDGDLHQVLGDLLGLGAVPSVLLGDAVQLVQNLAGGVVNEHLDRGLGGHAAQNLLLGLQGHLL